MAVSAFTQLGTTVSSNTSGQSSLASGSITFPTTGTPVLGIVSFSVSGTTTAETFTVSDNLGNTWTVVPNSQVDNAVGSGSGHQAIAYFLYPSAGGGTTATVTVSWGTAVNERFAVFGYVTGHDTATPVDSAGTFNGIGSTTSAAVSTLASVAAGGLAITSYQVAGATAPTGYPGTGWTGIANPQDATRSRSGAFAYQQVSGAGVVTAPTYTNTASSITPPTYSIAVFKAPGTPVNTVAPAVTGTASIGGALSTTDGSWTNSPSSFAYQWQRDVGTAGSTWIDIAGATTNGYTVVKEDVGCKIRARVTATNGVGTSSPAASNQTATIAVPVGLTWRIIAGPIAQSDNQIHTNTTFLPALAGDKIIIFAGCSNANTIDGNGNKSDVGSFVDSSSHTWVQDSEAFSDTNIQHSIQAFSTQSSGGLPYGSTLTMYVNTIGSLPPSVADPLAYHGQSPYWFAVAVSTGDGTTLSLDKQAHQVDLLTTHVAPSVTLTNSRAIVFGFHAGSNLGSAGWWTAGAGFTEIVDTNPALGSGGETDYGISAEVQTTTTGYTGGAGGTTASNKTMTNMVIAYSVTGTVYTSAMSGGEEICGNSTSVFTPGSGGGAIAPSNTGAPVATGTAVQGNTLTTTTGTWANSPTSFTYQWQRDVAGNGVFSNIASATNSTYLLVAGDVNNKVRCVVTATNAAGSASANSNQLGPVSAPASGGGTPSKSSFPAVIMSLIERRL